VKATKKVLALVTVAMLALAGCGSSGDSTSSGSADATAAKQFSVANFVNGPLGDQGFFDDAERGIQALAKAGYTTKTVQSEANNPVQWKAGLEALCGKYDIIVLGSSQMTDILTATAAKYPDQKFLLYDNAIKAPNVASILFKQNEGSFLAGVLGGLVTMNKDRFPKATGSKIIGLVGGMDIPVINDFKVGFEAGAKAVDPTIQVKVSYIGNFTDANKGFDQAKAMFDQGADVVFQVAGGAGLGVLKAAKEAGRYGIGVDSNQNGLQLGFVLASMLKNVGNGIQAAITAASAGTLEYGEITYYGLANQGVGLAFENNGGSVPAEMQTKIKEYAQQVVDGKLTVPTVMG